MKINFYETLLSLGKQGDTKLLKGEKIEKD
jgi:hypothetical protein